MLCLGSPSPHVAPRFDDIDLPSAVKYLIASDPNLQVLGAAYLQHKCYSDGNAKKQVSTGAEGRAVPAAPPRGTPGDAGGGAGAAAGFPTRPGCPPRPAASRPCPSW